MNQMIFPPFLHQKDKVIILSPSGSIDKTFLKGACERLESWGLEVILAKHASTSYGRFAGTVSQRVHDFQKAMDNEQLKMIFCSRGGYGAVHLIDKLDFTIFRNSPKWLVGYSDITLLHQLFQKNGFVSLHAPMARHLAVEPESDFATQALKNILFGKIPVYECTAHPLNRQGKAAGKLIGGNLSVFYGLRGTPYDLIPEGSVLFIEDVGEKPYHIDRMMNNLKLGGILEKISGLIIGQFTEYEEDKLMKSKVYENIARLVKEYAYPVCFNFPAGHTEKNYPLIFGAHAELEVTGEMIKLKTISPNRELFLKD